MCKVCCLVREVLDIVVVVLRLGIIIDEIDEIVYKVCIECNVWFFFCGDFGFD